MPSYCDASPFYSDTTNHPNFTARLNNWTKDSSCTAVSDSTSAASSLTDTSCLTESEIACYSSYMLGKKRLEVDSSLENIYQPQNSKTAAFDSNYHTTILTGVLWAALGTTVLYYAFTKI